MNTNNLFYRFKHYMCREFYPFASTTASIDNAPNGWILVTIEKGIFAGQNYQVSYYVPKGLFNWQVIGVYEEI